jgi:acyl dehydratase
MDTSVLEKLRERIGKDEYTEVYEIERGMIRKLAKAIGDNNQLWWDPEYARQYGYQDVATIPALVLALGWDEHEAQFKPYMPYDSGMHASSEFEAYDDIKPGDVITVKCKLVDVFTRKGKMFGDMAFLAFERLYVNQDGQVVAKCRQTQISFPAEGGK